MICPETLQFVDHLMNKIQDQNPELEGWEKYNKIGQRTGEWVILHPEVKNVIIGFLPECRPTRVKWSLIKKENDGSITDMLSEEYTNLEDALKGFDELKGYLHVSEENSCTV